MDKLTMRAFDKLQKREHLLKSARNSWGLGRMTQEEFRKRQAAIIQEYELTNEEQQAYDRHIRMQRKRM